MCSDHHHNDMKRVCELSLDCILGRVTRLKFKSYEN